MCGVSLPTKDEVERMPFGRFEVRGSVTVDHAETAIERLRVLLDTLIHRLNEEGSVYWHSLRLIIFAPDLPAETARWQIELGEPVVGVSTSAEGVAIGKTFTWGSGDLPDTYSVILLSSGLGKPLVEGDALATATVVHELAHVSDNLVALRCVGPRRWPMNDDWPGIRAFLARSVWGEYFAEYTAAPYAPAHWSSDSIELSLAYLQQAIQQVREAIAAYWSHPDVGLLWSRALVLNRAFNQVGRTFGLIDAGADTNRADVLNAKLLQGIRALSSPWETVAGPLCQDE